MNDRIEDGAIDRIRHEREFWRGIMDERRVVIDALEELDHNEWLGCLQDLYKVCGSTDCTPEELETARDRLRIAIWGQ